MKKILKYSIYMLVITMLLAGCNKTKEEDKKELKIGSIGFNHDEINAEEAIKILEDKGYKVECLVFENATVMNEAILEGSLDTSLHQHKPWMDNFNEQNGSDLIMLEPYIHCNEYSMMSSKYKNVEDLPDGAKISISDDGSNQARALLFLKELGLIELQDGVTVPTVLDITSNKKNLEIIPIQHHQVIATMDDVDACMTSTYLLLSNDLPMDRVIASSDDYKEYGVGFVIDAKNKDKQWTKDIIEAYTTDEMREKINELFKGGFIPGF